MREFILPDKLNHPDRFMAYEASEFPFEKLTSIAIKTRKQGAYLTNICTYDIETTSMVQGDLKYGYMYHWQMCVDGICVYGRYWQEWTVFLKRLSDALEVDENRRLVIWVHNLGFEYQFMKHFLRRDFGDISVFAPQPRKPLRVTTDSGLEFRCSWKLSNMSLEKFTQNELYCQHVKRAGDLNYSILRTPATPLTDKEFGYCMCDVLSLYEAIKSIMQSEHDTMESIPMTSTGYVRRDCRKAARNERGYRNMFKSCRMDMETYKLLKEASRGGDTHANRKRAGRVIRDVDSYDVQSSYPAMMLLRKFPMTKFQPYGELETKAELQELLETKACLFRLTLTGLRVREEYAFPYISDSKCSKLLGPLLDNGRVLKADGLTISVTDVDYKIIAKQYEFDEIYVQDMEIAEYGYLPDSIRSVVYNYFARKTELKYKKDLASGSEKEELEYLYGKAKNKLNGIFGMCFTDPVHDEVFELEDGRWKKRKPDDIQAALDKYNKSRNSFLVYAWGVWVTAHARKHLADLVDAAGQEASLYCDTDSDKGHDMDHAAIEACNERIKAECEERGAYYDCNGIRYYLGIYEREKPYRAFKTLGAKKYMYRDKSGNHVTISGVNKKKGSVEIKSLYNFKTGFIFRQAGGVELAYHEAPIKQLNIDGCTFESASSVCVTDSTYTLSVTDDYKNIIGGYYNGKI